MQHLQPCAVLGRTAPGGHATCPFGPRSMQSRLSSILGFGNRWQLPAAVAGAPGHVRTSASRTLDLPLLWLPTTATCGSANLKSRVTCARASVRTSGGSAEHGAGVGYAVLCMRVRRVQNSIKCALAMIGRGSAQRAPEIGTRSSGLALLLTPAHLAEYVLQPVDHGDQ